MKKILFILLLVYFVALSPVYSQWQIEKQFDNYFLHYISIVDTGVVWTVGMNYQNTDTQFVAVRTPHSGWKSLPVQGLPTGFITLTCIAGTDSSNAWVGTKTGRVYRTTNAGANWTLQLDAGDGYVNDIQFSGSNPDYGYIFCDPVNSGAPFTIYKTSDGGNNWITFSPAVSGYIGYDRSGCVTDSSHAWFGLYCVQTGCFTSKIIYTSNGGLNWNTTTLPENNSYYISGVEFKDDNQFGLAVSNNIPAYIQKTTNNGLNWSVTFTKSNPGDVHNLKWIKNSSNWYYATSDFIYKSTNDGLSWNQMIDNVGSTEDFDYLDAISSSGKIYGWAVTNSGKIMKLLDSISTIGINNITAEIPRQYNIYQNYPNPFNPITKIKFDIPSNSFVSLIVYDALGRMLEYPVNQQLSAGTYEVDFDASKYSSGIYYYKLLSNSYSQTRKMVLVK